MPQLDVLYETWWNGLTPELRGDVLQLIPTMGIDQREIFARRLWHELHAWLRVEARQVYDRGQSTSGQIETFQDLIDNGLCPTPLLDPAHQSLPANLHGIPVMFASMIMTDGKTTHVGIYRGLLVGAKGHRYIDRNVNTTVHIATEVVRGGHHVANVNRLSSQYATTDWPAVDWNR